MRKLLALACAAVLVTACSGIPRHDSPELNGGYASPTGAAFMGYHGPMDRLNKPEE